MFRIWQRSWVSGEPRKGVVDGFGSSHLLDFGVPGPWTSSVHLSAYVYYIIWAADLWRRLPQDIIESSTYSW